MRARWVIPFICYSLLLAVEIFTIANVLLPVPSTFIFVGLYFLIPALSFLLAFLLSATHTNLFLKLFFPVMSLISIPLGFTFLASQGSPFVYIGHLPSDIALALIISFAPAAVGTAIGLIVWAIRKRHHPSRRFTRDTPRRRR